MDFIKGMDISMLKELEELGAIYYDNGVERDIFQIFKNYDINAIRLRLWNNPYDDRWNSYGGGRNNFTTTVELAERVIKARMSFVLNIHYSDFWTDPGKQIKPKAWKDLSGTDLENEVYRYTNDLIKDLKMRGLTPDMVQIGNELTNGFLWPDGKVPNYGSMMKLLKKGISAVRDVSRDIKIIIHLDNGGNNAMYRDWFDRAADEGLDYDIIGLSYYPYWHGTLDELEYNMNDITHRYDKDVLVVETAYGFTTVTHRYGKMIFSNELADKVLFEPTKLGQSQFITELMNRIKRVNNQRGKGFFYWEPVWIPVEGLTWATLEGRKYINDKSEGGNTWANQALFDFNGNVLPALKSIRDFK